MEAPSTETGLFLERLFQRAHRPLEGTAALGSCQIPLVLSPASPWYAFMASSPNDSPSGPAPDLRRQTLQGRDLCPQVVVRLMLQALF